MNLTAIKNASEGDELKDDEVRGLHLRVRGGRKAWFFYYRVVGTGQRRRPKIGEWPAMTLPMARQIAREWLGEVARGKDPSGANATLRASETVASLCARYLAHTEGRASHYADALRVKNYLKPQWGNRRVAEITKADVHALKRTMRGKHVAFNRMLAFVNQLWRFADLPSPAAGIDRHTEEPRRRYLSEDERKRFEDALDETEPQFPHAVALIRALYLTGARFSEIAKSKRSQYKDGVLTLVKHKTAKKVGTRTIIFSQAAQDVIDNIDPRRGWLCGFSSVPWKAWELIRTRAGLEDFRIHDLRHSFASDALGEGFGLAEIGEVLGHRDPATTKRYAHLAETKQRAVAEAVAKARGKQRPRLT